MRREFDECRSNLVSRIWAACVVAIVVSVWSEKVGKNSWNDTSSNQPCGGSGSWG